MKNRSFNNHLFIAVLLIIMPFGYSACEREPSSAVSQDEIFTSYHYQYDEVQDISIAVVRFRFGSKTGTLLELSEPSEITVNDKYMTFNENLAQYSANFAGLVSDAFFLWKDTDGKEFRNAVHLKTVAFPELDTIARDESYEMFWEGEPLEEDEYVNVRISDISGENSKIFTANSLEGTSVIFPKNELGELLPGEAQIEMYRGISTDADEAAEAGGLINAQYFVESRTVILKE
jgi:hypothetical protein